MIEQFIRNYGLIAVILGVALEGDATMILAGVAAHLRLLSLSGVLVVGVIGAWVGDAVWYAAGRFAGGYFNRQAKLKAASERIGKFTHKFGIWSIFASRFIWGTRIMTMTFWGYHRLSFLRFAVMDLVGCSLWAILLGFLGYTFSKSAELLIGEVKTLEIWLFISVIVSVIAVFIFHRIYKRV